MATTDNARASAVAEALVGLADSLVAEYDTIDLLHRLATDCVDLLPINAAGLLLTDQQGALRAIACSTEQARLLELVEVHTAEGPSRDCFTTRQLVSVPDLLDPVETRWPEFTAEARRAGFRAVHALPLRLREETIGALNLFSTKPGELQPEYLKIGQALADIATIGIVQERALFSSELLVARVQDILNSRVILEQAKGVLAERLDIGPQEAFTRLRYHARNTDQRLTDLARGVVYGTITLP
jgi:transcriptional regulator with GAF, ATPase, and Fis domain